MQLPLLANLFGGGHELTHKFCPVELSIKAKVPVHGETHEDVAGFAHVPLGQ
jgi:hypothetical protein